MPFPSIAILKKEIRCWLPGVKNRITLNGGDPIILVNTAESWGYDKAISCYHFVPFKALLCGAISIHCFYNWKKGYTKLPVIHSTEIDMFGDG